ncbi:hypothetical protein MMC14_004971 [Varicellaria rhodocarpa]|nr:hypothetical protein [Varicellaria rhodocarpa]
MGKMHSYQVSSSTSPDYLELLPATTYQPPSPRGRLIAHQYVRPSARLENNAMPTPEEIIAATRTRRSSSTSSTSSTDTNSSTASSIKSERRRGCLFLDLLPEHREVEN